MSTSNTLPQRRASLMGWVEIFDPNYQRFYYYNEETQQTSWYHPRENPTLQNSTTNTSTNTTATTTNNISNTTITTTATPSHPLPSIPTTPTTTSQQPITPKKEDTVPKSSTVKVSPLLLSPLSPSPSSTRSSDSNVAYDPNGSSPMKKGVVLRASDSDQVLRTPRGRNKVKRRRRQFASISDQFYAVYERVEKKQSSSVQDYNNFTIKDKFIILHLTHLTSMNNHPQKVHVFEEELKQNPMLFSCMRGDTQKFTELLNKNHRKLNETLPTSKVNALHLAVASGNIHLVKYLISCVQTMKTLAIDQNTFNGLTPLHLATLFGLTQIVGLLIEAGADTNVTCSSIPIAPPYFKAVIEYWERVKDFSASFFTPFLYCIFGGSIETLLFFVEANKKSDGRVNIEQNREGFLIDALSLACILQHVKMVDIMLKEDYVFNYDVNVTDSNGMTPIMFLALTSGNGSICSKLLAKPVYIVGVNRLNGCSCLHLAISRGNYGFIKKVCRSRDSTEELAILLRIHNPKQPLNPLQYVNSKEIQVSPEIRKKMEIILKSHGATELTGFSGIVKEGYLTKQGHVVKNWKKRWFVLRIGQLQYFKSLTKLKEPKGSINLVNGSVAKTFTKGCFVLYDASNDKKYFITAPSEEEMLEWMDAIQFSINQA